MFQDKDSWFKPPRLSAETITLVIQECIIPRIMFTAADAIYTAKFINTMHNIETKGFITVLWIDRVSSKLLTCGIGIYYPGHWFMISFSNFSYCNMKNDQFDANTESHS